MPTSHLRRSGHTSPRIIRARVRLAAEMQNPGQDASPVTTQGHPSNLFSGGLLSSLGQEDRSDQKAGFYDPIVFPSST